MMVFDAWSGASAAHNRCVRSSFCFRTPNASFSNPLCEPFSPGHKIISLLGTFVTAIEETAFVNVGGDGMLNCDSSAQCHMPQPAAIFLGYPSIDQLVPPTTRSSYDGFVQRVSRHITSIHLDHHTAFFCYATVQLQMESGCDEIHLCRTV
jgi:hypothetical protein